MGTARQRSVLRAQGVPNPPRIFAWVSTAPTPRGSSSRSVHEAPVVSRRLPLSRRSGGGGRGRGLASQPGGERRFPMPGRRTRIDAGHVIAYQDGGHRYLKDGVIVVEG